MAAVWRVGQKADTWAVVADFEVRTAAEPQGNSDTGRFAAETEAKSALVLLVAWPPLVVVHGVSLPQLDCCGSRLVFRLHDRPRLLAVHGLVLGARESGRYMFPSRDHLVLNESHGGWIQCVQGRGFVVEDRRWNSAVSMSTVLVKDELQLRVAAVSVD